MMTFPLEGCIIPRPCKALQEQGLTLCPGRLGTAQTRETEAQPGAETPEDTNPPSEPPGAGDPICHARARMEPSTPHLAAPSLQTIASTLGCPRLALGVCWGLRLASPGQGTAAPSAQPCLLLPARRCLPRSLKLFLPGKKQFQAEEGKGEHRKPAGLAAAPWGHGHLLLSIASATHPSSVPCVPRPLPASPARQRGGHTPAPAHKGAGPEQWSRPALPRHAATPASASAGTRGTASRHRGHSQAGKAGGGTGEPCAGAGSLQGT